MVSKIIKGIQSEHTHTDFIDFLLESHLTAQKYLTQCFRTHVHMLSVTMHITGRNEEHETSNLKIKVFNKS